MSAWQPVATAPQDETHILLFTTCHGMVEAWFFAGRWVEFHEGREYEGPSWVCADDAFQIEVEEIGGGEMHHGTATHWMALPAPPPKSEAQP